MISKALVRLLYLAAIGLTLAAITGPAHAMDWLAERLRGDVYRVENAEWVPVLRGDVVPTGTIVWTTRNGYVDFRSGENLVSLTPETQVKFIERAAQGQNWVQLWFGEVDVEVEVRNVEHFAVQTPYMVAVVKGTAFSVSSDDDGAEVEVKRGVVAVRETSTDSHVTLTAGQRVSGDPAGTLAVAGSGVLPVVMDASGNPIAAAAVQAAGGNGAARGNSGNTPAANETGHGNSGNTPAATGNRPGNSGNTPASTNANSGGNSGGNGNGNAAANFNSNAGGNGNGHGRP
ncbi:FecR domain-containing protein [Pelagibacterium halotolerans]|uniref:FecR domain-containing protein n=1 Tax=Pelagibacterium halotolerans TaxID=531813 RepID=UPI00384F38F3